ncbi:MAG TPA: ABC transporter ATP-binding protein [Terriglobia bacterium]|nr:ABC transporter ATP-binding protein [Terriglobia bacterium]
MKPLTAWAVETSELTKDYSVGFWRRRRKRALDDLTLGVEQGEIFGLLGPNGAGKTTTLKIFLRLVYPSSGTARILGRSLDDLSMHARIGYLPENPSFYDHLTAREFLTYTAELFGLTGAGRRRRVNDLIGRVGLGESGDLALRKYSKGMIQRLGIAQALVNDPELIFLDEPMSGLDPLGRREVRDLILELRRAGKTVFFSTHILSDAETLCDRVAILHRGRLHGVGDLREILMAPAAATELVIERPSPAILEKLKPYIRSVVQTGDRVRLEISAEHDTARVLEVALREGARVVSLNPVKASLEEYFMAHLGHDAPSGAPSDTEDAEPAKSRAQS